MTLIQPANKINTTNVYGSYNYKMSKNIFPLHLIKLSEGSNAMIELKSGENFNGILRGVDKFMNIKMETAILSDKEGQVFHKVKQVYIRGNTIKYFSLDNDIISKLQGTQYVCPQNWKKVDMKNYKMKQKTKN